MPLEVTKVNPRFGKRSWVKLWVNEWLDGTTRFEMTDAQRAFWVDLLAMAGRSRFPGRICAGQVEGVFIGYPLNKFQALMSEPIDVAQTLALFEKTGKIRISVTTETPTKLVMLELVNWDKFQSEYQRQKKYRKRGLQRSDSQSDTQSNKTEGDTEVEVEGDTEAAATSAAFAAISCEPFGSTKFKKIWRQEFENHKGNSWADTMERVAEICKANRIKVPGRFFAHKREIEKLEAAQTYKRTPL